MGGDILMMKQNELKRLEYIKKAIAKQLTQSEASGFLGISLRQAQRLVKRVREIGNKGIVHQGRGKASHRRISDAIKAKVLRVYGSRYKDFGATLASEKVAKHEGIKLGRETLRKWLRQEGYEAARRRSRKHRSRRERKEHYGQMVQMDGSHHDWLEGRVPRLVLMGYIDDATNRIYGRFYEYEGTIPAMDSFKRYCLKYGVPQSVYLDCHSTYKANAKTIEQANKALEGYLIEHNRRYLVEPARSANLHRIAPAAKELDNMLCKKQEHPLRKDFTVVHDRKLYQIAEWTSVNRIEVREQVDGSMRMMGRGRSLKFKAIADRPVKKRVRLTQKVRWPKDVVKPYRQIGRLVPLKRSTLTFI